MNPLGKPEAAYRDVERIMFQLTKRRSVEASGREVSLAPDIANFVLNVLREQQQSPSVNGARPEREIESRFSQALETQAREGKDPNGQTTYEQAEFMLTTAWRTRVQEAHESGLSMTPDLHKFVQEACRFEDGDILASFSRDLGSVATRAA